VTAGFLDSKDEGRGKSEGTERVVKKSGERVVDATEAGDKTLRKILGPGLKKEGKGEKSQIKTAKPFHGRSIIREKTRRGGNGKKEKWMKRMKTVILCSEDGKSSFIWGDGTGGFMEESTRNCIEDI